MGAFPRECALIMTLHSMRGSYFINSFISLCIIADYQYLCDVISRLFSYQQKYYRVIVLLIMTILTSCSYSHKKIDYPVDFKYASISIEYSGVQDSLKSVVADSIYSSVSRSGLIITPVDSLKGDSLLIVNALVVKKGAGIGITLLFYPQGGNQFTEIYFSEVKKEDPIATIHAQSIVPFSDNYNFNKAIEILNEGLITTGGMRNLFRKE